MTESTDEAISTSDLYELLQPMVSSLAFLVERQATVIARLTEPEPSALPWLAPIAMKVIEYVTAKTATHAAARMGPEERRVVAEYEMDHARLLKELEQKRVVARAADRASHARAEDGAAAGATPAP